MKSTVDLRPVYHHKEDRIRARAVLCRLALLLTGLADAQSGQIWRNRRAGLPQLHEAPSRGRRAAASDPDIATNHQQVVVTVAGAPDGADGVG